MLYSNFLYKINIDTRYIPVYIYCGLCKSKTFNTIANKLRSNNKLNFIDLLIIKDFTD